MRKERRRKFNIKDGIVSLARQFFFSVPKVRASIDFAVFFIKSSLFDALLSVFIR